MIRISKKEMEYLTSKGVRFHENGISVTHSKHSGKSWYLTETVDNIKMLNEYNNSIIKK